MDEQEKIQVDNLILSHCTSYARNHPFQSVGQIIHFLYIYGNLQISELAAIGIFNVKYQGQTLCTFVYDHERKIPIFDFIEEYDWMQKKQKLFLDNFEYIKEQEKVLMQV